MVGSFPAATPVIWDEVRYSSLHAAARATNRTPSSMHYLIVQMGYTGEADLVKKRTGMWWNDVFYKTFALAGEANNVSESTMRWRRKQGYDRDEDILRGKE